MIDRLMDKLDDFDWLSSRYLFLKIILVILGSWAVILSILYIKPGIRDIGIEYEEVMTKDSLSDTTVYEGTINDITFGLANTLGLVRNYDFERDTPSRLDLWGQEFASNLEYRERVKYSILPALVPNANFVRDRYGYQKRVKDEWSYWTTNVRHYNQKDWHLFCQKLLISLIPYCYFLFIFSFSKRQKFTRYKRGLIVSYSAVYSLFTLIFIQCVMSLFWDTFNSIQGPRARPAFEVTQFVHLFFLIMVPVSYYLDILNRFDKAFFEPARFKRLQVLKQKLDLGVISNEEYLAYRSEYKAKEKFFPE